MFAKLLKHEWRATRGVIGLLCIIILISGLTIGCATNYVGRAEKVVVVLDEDTVSSQTAMSDFEEVACALLIMAGIIAVAVCCAASSFYVIYRFYKRCFTDEGYLTFTLPVTNHQILLSSITNCVLSELLVMVAALMAIAIAGGLFILAFNQDIIWADVWVVWKDVWQQIVDSFWKNIGQFARLGFSGIVGAFSELVLLMTAVTIGALAAKKHKILAAVGVYYGIGMVKSFAYSMVALNAATTQDVNTLLTMPGIVSAVLAVAGYFTMHYLTSKKLNLT